MVKKSNTEDWQTDRVVIASNGLIDCVPFIKSIIIVKFVQKLHLLAKDLSSYTVKPTDIGLCSCGYRSADLRAEAEEFVALKGQLRMLPNLEVNIRGCTWSTGSLLYTSLTSSMKASHRFLSLSDSVRRDTISNPQS